jgi:hypothetical protein
LREEECGGFVVEVGGMVRNVMKKELLLENRKERISLHSEVPSGQLVYVCLCGSWPRCCSLILQAGCYF